MITTTTKTFSEKVRVSALNTFFIIWLFIIAVATAAAVFWGVLPEFF